MIPGVRDVLSAILIGIGASALMDLWNLFLRKAFGIRSLDYCLLGRWIRHMPQGVFRHASIAAATPMPRECVLGWVAHYAIGAGLSVSLVFVVSRTWLLEPTFLPALMWGLGSVIFPMFVMQPALGLGFAASKTPNPTMARLKSLATHTVFGIGLYVFACVFDALGQ